MMPHAGVHTLNITKKITPYEVARICRTMGVPEIYDADNTLLIAPTGRKGLKCIKVRQNPTTDKNGVMNGVAYLADLEVNAVDMVGKNAVAMLELSPANVDILFQKVDDVLNFLQLDVRNSKCENWTLVRLDCGFDLKISYRHPNELGYLMRLMNYSLSLLNSRKCSLPLYKAPEQSKYQSLRFGNGSYTYNIYIKEIQLRNTRQMPLKPEEIAEVDGLIRFEKQLTSKGVASNIGSPQKLALLRDEAITRKLMSSMVKELQLFFGTGNYVSYDKAMDLIDRADYSNEEKEALRILYAASYKHELQRFIDDVMVCAKAESRDEDALKKNLQDWLKLLGNLGIMPAGLYPEEISDMGVDTMANINYWIDEYIRAKKPTKAKSAFATPYQIEGGKRWKCNPSIKDAVGKSKRYQVVGSTLEEVEQGVLNKLTTAMMENLDALTNEGVVAKQSVVEQSVIQINNFKEVVESEAVHQAINALLLNIAQKYGIAVKA